MLVFYPVGAPLHPVHFLSGPRRNCLRGAYRKCGYCRQRTLDRYRNEKLRGTTLYRSPHLRTGERLRLLTESKHARQCLVHCL